jgi:hypothetical protein
MKGKVEDFDESCEIAKRHVYSPETVKKPKTQVDMRSGKSSNIKREDNLFM